ncbi:hypothetical protein [Pseudaminobacter soli (ex Li et al. 2025)]|uniref:Uncharacterized protein n=1 Tax=Pseudaminobacter soli (ex Li et al. 2025) TaxID=1295366 RepID=A0A2P7S7P0_9HYPH|nr:hypothetical protein [Mesorhizobium soli]PSJ58484.1 hypothetical protein C7I85_18930 [Mesorhizobium soli]
MLTISEEFEGERPFSDSDSSALPAALRFASRPSRVSKATGEGRRWGKYIHWSRKDVAELKRLAEEDMPTPAIARRFNRSARAVRSRAAREGISLAGRWSGED